MTDDHTPTPSTLSEPTDPALQLLAEQLQAAMMGLAVAGLYQDGQGAALAAIDHIAAGKAELQCEARRAASGFELVIWYASHGQRQRVTHLKLRDMPAPQSSH